MKELKGLKHRKIVPTIDKQTLRQRETAKICGVVPDGLWPSGFQAGFSYTRLLITVGFYRIDRGPDHGTIALTAVYRDLEQPWDMGGSYLAPAETYSDRL